MTQSGASAALTGFEQARLANIQRNNQIMEGMGIPGLVPQELRARAASSRAAGPTARRKRGAVAPPLEDDTRERRRSSRLASIPAVVFTTFEEDEDLGDGRRRRGGASKAAASAPAADDGEAAPPPASVAPDGVAGVVAAGSSKGMRAQVAEMQASWLGKQIAPTDGSGSYKFAAMSRLRGGGGVKFNKYSGIQEWENAVALFVNVRGKAGAYANIFLQGGRQMTWFAQPTQDADTPVIRRLLACTDTAAATPVVLLIREEGCAYVYAGKLTCALHYPTARPLKLVWQLTDFDALQAAPDFKALMDGVL